MAINEQLTGRVRALLAGVDNVEEKKMFSGIAFMIDDKMCITVRDEQIMCRVDPALSDELAEQPGCSEMNMNGKVYKGYIVVKEAVIATEKALQFWVKLALDFNPRAKSSKKKTKTTPPKRV